jgi:hypothetical protein
VLVYEIQISFRKSCQNSIILGKFSTMNQFKLLWVVLVIGFFACKDAPTDTITVPVVDTAASRGVERRIVADPPEVTDFIIIPKVKVGPITANYNQDSLIATFGLNNVITDEVAEGDGLNSYMITTVYPNTNKALYVRWAKGLDLKKIQSVRFEADSSVWKTEQGLTIGSTLDQIVAANGKDFKFYGFDIDQNGSTNLWEGGKLSKNLSVVLNPTKPEVVYQEPKLVGDGTFSSANPQAKKAGLRILSMSVQF